MAGRKDPFLIKKWEHVFNVFFDTDKSRMIDWDDFELLMDTIKRRRGENSDDFRLAQKSLKIMWDALSQHADKNGDNKVSMEEWLEMWRNAPKDYLPWQKAYLHFMFKLLDTSSDNLISKPEYIDAMMCYGIEPADASKAFDRFAVDKDGKPLQMIDYQRFQGLWNEFFYSSNPNAPGNYLFGLIA